MNITGKDRAMSDKPKVPQKSGRLAKYQAASKARVGFGRMALGLIVGWIVLYVGLAAGNAAFGVVFDHPFLYLKDDSCWGHMWSPVRFHNAGFALALQLEGHSAQLAPSNGSSWSDAEMPENHWETKSGVVGHFAWSVD